MVVCVWVGGGEILTRYDMYVVPGMHSVYIPHNYR